MNHIKEKNNKLDCFNLRKSIHQIHYKGYGHESCRGGKMCVLHISNKGLCLVQL